MAQYEFSVYEVEQSYYSGNAPYEGDVLSIDRLTITDDDGLLHATNSTDTGSAQTFDFESEPAVTNYSVSYLDFAQIDGSGPEYELFAMQVMFSDGETKYYVMSKDPDFHPAIGQNLQVSSYGTFTNTDYGQINAAVCFTPGTLILTPAGEVPVETIRPGDMVQTMDNGPKRVRWIGRRDVDHESLRKHVALRPVLIREGVFGNRRPLLVSQQHRMLINTGIVSGNPDEGDALIRAKHVAEYLGGAARIAKGKRRVTYIHLLLETHEILFAEGAATESLFPGPATLNGVSREDWAEIELLFPDLSRTVSTKSVSNAFDLTPMARPLFPRREVIELAKALDGRAPWRRGESLGRAWVAPGSTPVLADPVFTRSGAPTRGKRWQKQDLE